MPRSIRRPLPIHACPWSTLALLLLLLVGCRSESDHDDRVARRGMEPVVGEQWPHARASGRRLS